jgi:hypothetical protein
LTKRKDEDGNISLLRKKHKKVQKNFLLESVLKKTKMIPLLKN